MKRQCYIGEDDGLIYVEIGKTGRLSLCLSSYCPHLSLETMQASTMLNRPLSSDSKHYTAA